MKILTNDNNEYFGLISDYKNGQAFKDAIIADGAEGKLAITKTLLMRPLTEQELSEEGEYSTYEPGHWIPVDVSCETSDVFYLAVETDIPVTKVIIENIRTDKELTEKDMSMLSKGVVEFGHNSGVKLTIEEATEAVDEALRINEEE